MLKNKLFLIAMAVIIISTIVFAVVSLNSSPSKEGLIKIFNDNYELFSDIEKYTSEQNSNVSIHKYNNNIVISINGQEESSDNLPVKYQVEYIINKLRFERILGKDGPALKNIIVFQRTSGGLEQGIVYLKDDSGKYGMEMVKIRDNWYYYSIGHI